MCYCLFALLHQCNYLSAYFTTMNDECEPPVPKKSLLLYVELFYKKYAEKNAPALR